MVGRPLTATADVAHPPDAVFTFLSDLRNHWRLEPHFLELEGMGPGGGRVRVRGPLGLSRAAETAVVGAERPRLLTGTARIGRGTEGLVRWEIVPVPGSSRVTFSADVVRASALDRVLLVLGGRWWLLRIVRRAVERLGASIDAQLPDRGG
ncbi:MAG: SRPBCC family protein [Gaiellaceae bacterium]